MLYGTWPIEIDEKSQATRPPGGMNASDHLGADIEPLGLWSGSRFFRPGDLVCRALESSQKWGLKGHLLEE